MKEWLSKLHEFFLDQEAFVVATTYAYHGSSPETPGVALLHSSKKTHRLTASDFRYQAMRDTAVGMLANPTPYHVEELALGKVAGFDNGHCDVIYEYFDAQHYPDWLKKLRTYSHAGTGSTLLREFKLGGGNTPIQTTVLCDVTDNKDGIDCWMQKNATTHNLYRTIQSDTIKVALIGSHPVADEIQKQCAHLPIDPVRIHNLPGQLPEQLSDHSIVIIMTTDHELDYQYCETLLRSPGSDSDFFVGCIGSEKKAGIFNDRLTKNGISERQLNQLHMPIGLAEISGKQNAVVAASIIAQILTRHSW